MIITGLLRRVIGTAWLVIGCGERSGLADGCADEVVDVRHLRTVGAS
jgi:hypothetical protein